MTRRDRWLYRLGRAEGWTWSRLRVGTSRNLFSVGEFAPTEAVYEAKLDGIVSTILDHDVDIVGFQEVGDQQAFDDLLAALGQGWDGVLSAHPDHRGIRVAVVSRLSQTSTEEVVDLPAELAAVQVEDDGSVMARMGRGALRMAMQTPAGQLDVVSCHLKSKLITYPGGRFQPVDEGQRARYTAYALYRRAAEATAVRAFADHLLDGQGTQRRVMVLGDMNDEPKAATTQILQGPSGSEVGTAGALRLDKGDAWRLFNLVGFLPEGQRATRIFEGRSELIDHIFVSRALLETVEAVSTVAPRSLPSITDDANARRNATVSDHAMITAQLDLG
jgi:endonuclease/exonuclease/phosphatase family metal-dependent hydrolase